jgi:hypothetical protein
MGWTAAGSEFESRHGQDFPPPHVVQTGCLAHPASYPMCTAEGGGALSPEVTSRREANHSLPPSADVKNTRAIPPLPHTPAWRSAFYPDILTS